MDEVLNNYLAKACGENVAHLHPKRMFEIINIILGLFKGVNVQTFKFCGASFAKMLGIKLKPYSRFTPEHIAALQKFTASYWKEGLCVSTGNKRAIYYNDTFNCPPNEQQFMCELIINHELAHLILQHTEQCTIAEEEAIFFTAILSLFNTILNTLQLQNMLTAQTADLFITGILNGINKETEVNMTQTKAKGAL